MRVDVHTHAQPPEFLKSLIESGRYEVERGQGEQLIVKEQGARFLTVVPAMHQPSDRIAAMDAAGIDVQVLSVSVPQVYFLEGLAAVELARLCNDALAAIVQQYPDRFRALASVPLTADIDSAIEELGRCMDTLGMPGFLIGANINGQPLDDPKLDPFYEEANRRGAVMHIHPMAPAGIASMGQYALAPLVGFPFDTTQAIARLIFSDFFGRFLGINVVGSHLGGAIPFLANRLDAGYRTYPECQGISRPPSEVLERLYLDTTGASSTAIELAGDLVGEDHLLFGSDYPHVVGDLAGGIAAIESSVSRRHRGKILGDNAAALYGLTT
ncbi:MAG TPA: amidohydrolase family protein [Thermomicrobiales bacterium]|nr:amidohydrolase family protein [Thermomicrobiales bacterium]